MISTKNLVKVGLNLALGPAIPVIVKRLVQRWRDLHDAGQGEVDSVTP